FTSRQQSLKQALSNKGLTALLVLGHENIRYLSGFSGNAAYALITAEKCVLITDYRYFGRAQAESIGFDVVSSDRDSETLGQWINRLLTTKSKLGFDAD
ncbi:aminopeptidase P family N-terminal domain-containing protein, partial [Pseudoalteromonas sp. S1650]|uniref:aminopeptidase P family N-terminal domain-containing protein n=1 Tax=Pseudoalteromonas sp. S1650 TaxID=579509 RepID=UPI00126AB298